MTDNQRQLIQVVTFDQYNKISDDILYIGECMVMRFNVALTRKDKYGERQTYHKEFEYGPKYDRRNSIRRSYDFYISIENFKPSEQGYRDTVRITMADMYHLRSTLTMIFRWYFDKAYANMYMQKGADLVLMNRPDRIELPVSSFDKKITFEASIYIDKLGIKHPGLRIYLNNENNFTDMPVDTFLAMKYFIDNLNMYESAQSMINYMGRPEFGTNSFALPDEEDVIMQQEKDIDYKEGRQIPGTKGKSFFDRVDNKMK